MNVGMDRRARTAFAFQERCSLAGANPNSLYHIGSQSPTCTDQLEKGKKFASIVHSTDEEERVVFSVAFALNVLMRVALDIDDFSNVVDQIAERPSVWSVISRMGVHQSLRYSAGDVRARDPSRMGLTLPAYEQPVRLELNGRPALRATILLKEPVPPLQLCAGIVEVYAEHPADPGKRLLIQLVASRR